MTTISLSLRSGYAADVDARTAASWAIERVGAARAAGLDGLFVGDHHAVGERVYLQNGPLLGRLLAEWGDARAGALFLLPLWHPLVVAEQVATLAALARGRFVLQCAIGAGEEQFAALGVELSERVARFETALPLIRQLLAGEEVSAEGPYRLSGARMGLVPSEPVEVWVGGHADAALDRAARLGDGWLAGPDLLPARATELAERYRERCAAHGRTPTVVAIRRDVHVGASTDDAHAVADPILARGYRGFDPAACLVGDPAGVAEQIQALAGAGFDEVVIRHLADDQRDVLASLGRMAEVCRLLSSS